MECRVGLQIAEEKCKGVCGYVQEVKGYKGHDKKVIRIRTFRWCGVSGKSFAIWRNGELGDG